MKRSFFALLGALAALSLAGCSGADCGPNQKDVDGKCVCETGFSDCDGDASNGCENPLPGCACVPSCEGKVCGADGCGGSCGTCTFGTCNSSGQCECTPQCGGKTCGPDGCGGVCGTCSNGQSCSTANQCITTDPLTSCTAPEPQYTGTFTADQFCEARAKVICDRMARCCLLGDGMYDKCVDFQTADCDEQEKMARIRAGITNFDVAKAKTCLDLEAQRVTCDGTMYELLAPECDNYNLFPFGEQPQDAPCFDRNDCAKLRCDRGMGTCDPAGTPEAERTNRGGTCQPYRVVGDTCNTSDLYCNPMKLGTSSPASYCDATSGLCVERAANGTSCTGNFMCKSGFCQNVCTDRKAFGQPCGVADQCAAGPDCGGTSCACTGTCARPFTGGGGALCRLPSQSVYGAGTECDYKTTYCKGATQTEFGTCTAFTAAGSPCVEKEECGPTAACAGSPKVCTPLKDPGESCTHYSQCKSGLTCSSQVCVTLGGDGAVCASDYDCQRFGRCNTYTGKCELAPGTAGEACSELIGPVCEEGYCGVTDKVCKALLGDGQQCNSLSRDYDEACGSGDCEKVDSSTWLCRPTCIWQ